MNSATSARSVFATGEVADAIGVQSWRIARLFQLGILPEPPRMSGRRVIAESDIPTIIEALVARGWLDLGASD